MGEKVATEKPGCSCGPRHGRRSLSTSRSAGHVVCSSSPISGCQRFGQRVTSASASPVRSISPSRAPSRRPKSGLASRRSTAPPSGSRSRRVRDARAEPIHDGSKWNRIHGNGLARPKAADGIRLADLPRCLPVAQDPDASGAMDTCLRREAAALGHVSHDQLRHFPRDVDAKKLGGDAQRDQILERELTSSAWTGAADVGLDHASLVPGVHVAVGASDDRGGRWACPSGHLQEQHTASWCCYLHLPHVPMTAAPASDFLSEPMKPLPRASVSA